VFRLKTTDTTPRVIFLPRYADLLLTQPLLLATLGVISKADTSVLVSLVGYDILMILAALVGAINVAPFKYMWWFAGLILLILIIIQLVQRCVHGRICVSKC
jgi:bacteriorhodopsin